MRRRQFLASAVILPEITRVATASILSLRVPELIPDADLRDIVRDMTALRAVLTRQDNILGASAVAPTVTHQLSIMRKLSVKSRGQARDLLVDLQAAYAEFDSWLSDELGDRKTGQFWIDRALEWSHEAGDDLVIGYILARKAQRAIDDGEPSAAISLARAAQRCSLTDRVRAAAFQYEAIGHASLSEALEFSQSIDRAHSLTSSLPPAHDGDWAPWCTPEYGTIHEAQGWVLLGEPRRAVAAYQEVLSKWPREFARDEGVYYGRLAQAQVLARNLDGVVRAGRKAIDIASRTGSARIVAELAPLTGALTEWQDSALAIEFRAELLEVLPSLESSEADQ